MAKITGRFSIGDWVEIRAKATFQYVQSDKKELVRVSFSRPRAGQICGIAEKCTGWYKSGYKGGYGEDSEPPYFEVDKVIPVWEVRLGMKNRPVLVLNEDVNLITEHTEHLPWFYADQPSMPPGYQEMLRNEMKDWPRDSGGRWIRKIK